MEATLDHGEIARRGEAVYERDLRDRVEPTRNGEFLVLDVESGDSEVDPNEVEAIRRLAVRRPSSPQYIKRIGYATAHRLGGRMEQPSEELIAELREWQELGTSSWADFPYDETPDA